MYVIESGRRAPIEVYEDVEWVVERGEDRLEVRWGADSEFEYAFMTGKMAGDDIRVEDKCQMRGWRTAELMAAARSAGLSLMGHYGDFSADSTDEVTKSIALSGDTNLGLQQCFCFSLV